MTAPEYEVVWPLGKLVRPMGTLAPRVPDLNGKTICELSNYAYFREEQTFAELERLIAAKYPGVKFIPYHVPTIITGVVITVISVSNLTTSPVRLDEIFRYTCKIPVSESA